MVFIFCISLLISFFCISNIAIVNETFAQEDDAGEHYGPIPSHIVTKMKKYSWKEGCPVSIKDLYYVRVPYWGYDNKTHTGELIVHKDVAEEVYVIFLKLHRARFPIEKMRLINEYKGSDDASMADNNTSAFNFRPVGGNKKVLSNHSYGLAIDINPLINPYVLRDKSVMPPEGKKYVNRKLKVPGLITRESACYQIFKQYGWTWGGDWRTVKDYQHFQKQSLLKILKNKRKKQR